MLDTFTEESHSTKQIDFVFEVAMYFLVLLAWWTKCKVTEKDVKRYLHSFKYNTYIHKMIRQLLLEF